MQARVTGLPLPPRSTPDTVVDMTGRSTASASRDHQVATPPIAALGIPPRRPDSRPSTNNPPLARHG